MTPAKRKSYKLRRFQNGTRSNGDKFYNFSITVPTETAEQLIKVDQVHYTFELLPEITLPKEGVPEGWKGRTIKGLLFEPTSPLPEAEPELPAWATANGNPN